MANRDTLVDLAVELTIAFEPLSELFDLPGAWRDFLELLGWDFETAPAELATLRDPVLAAVSFANQEELDEGDVPTLLANLAAVFEAIADLGSAAGLPADFRDEFPRQLVDYVLVEHLMSSRARWGNLLLGLGIVRLEVVAASSPRLAFTRRALAFEDLDDLLSNPVAYLRDSYQWGSSDFEGGRMFRALRDMLIDWGQPVREQPLRSNVLEQLAASALEPARVSPVALKYILLESVDTLDSVSAGAMLFLLPETAADKPGFAVLPYSNIDLDESLRLSEQVSLQFKGGLDLSGGLGALVRPDRDVDFVTGLGSGASAPVGGNLTIALRLEQPGEPMLILGTRDASRLEFGGVSTSAGTRFDGGGKYDVFVEFAIENGKIVISPASGEADGFLSSLLPGQGFEVDFDLSVGFSTARGVYFGGSGGFEIELPTHLSLGPIEVLSASIGVHFKDGALPIDLTATIRGDLGGVVTTTIEKMGLRANLTFPGDRRGNLGPANLDLAFKPPTGLGVEVKSGPVSGGGYLYLDFDAGRYAGAVALSIYSVAVKAFGVIDTQFPDGSSGFSFVIVISAEFTPIQLGFGFTLIGVGGLLGIHRSMIADGLRKAVRTGSLEHLLFPRNPVRDAPAIISDLSSIFPPAKQHYVFGPMAKLGWGTPTLISAQLGIILEIPGPRLALIGVVEMALPTGKAALLSIHLACAGILDFPKRELSFDASLYDSHVVTFELSGDMAFRLGWGERPNFTLAVGGFNPVFQPPPGFPTLRRVAVDAGIDGNPRLTIQGYFALTSNTVQVGSSLDLYASGFGIRLEGHLGFDALFVFSPFSFRADFSAGVRVRFAGVGLGVGLHGTISGPSPFQVKAKVCVSVLWWDACLPVAITFGKKKREELPPIDPWTGELANNIVGLRQAVEDANNWSGSFPKGAHPVVTLTERATSGAPPIDPVGQARLQQKICPLNFKLSKFGAYKPQKNTVFNLRDVTIGDSTQPVVPINPPVLRDQFAPALYKEMGGAEKLSAQSYQLFDAGFTVNPEVVVVGDVPFHHVTYDTDVVDNNDNVTFHEQDFQLTMRHLLPMLSRSAAARRGIRRSGVERFVDPTRTVLLRLVDETYVVAHACSLERAIEITPAPTAHTLAQNALDLHLAGRPGDRGQYQVVPSYLAA